MRATFPQFCTWEEEYGSLIRGIRAAKHARMTAKKSFPSVFASFINGMSTLVNALEEVLAPNIYTNSVATSMKPLRHHIEITMANGKKLKAKAIILAIDAKAAASLLTKEHSQIKRELHNLRAVSSGSAYLAYPKIDLNQKLNGFGVVIPKVEQRAINAITWVSSKLEYRAPSDHALIRVFFGGSRNQEMMTMSDDSVLEIIEEELKQIMNIAIKPCFTRVYRWLDANPQYDIGHHDILKKIKEKSSGNMIFAGCAFGGVGIPDCIKQGRSAAEQAFKVLQGEL